MKNKVWLTLQRHAHLLVDVAVVIVAIVWIAHNYIYNEDLKLFEWFFGVFMFLFAHHNVITTSINEQRRLLIAGTVDYYRGILNPVVFDLFYEDDTRNYILGITVTYQDNNMVRHLVIDRIPTLLGTCIPSRIVRSCGPAKTESLVTPNGDGGSTVVTCIATTPFKDSKHGEL